VENADASVVLTERGDLEPVARHPDFRMFACMNPATDVGKKDLPPGLRMRFTEIYSPPPDDDTEALIAIVKQYLGDAVAGDRSAILDTAEFYMAIKGLSRVRDIVDGTNTPPHFSMRTLARALTFAVDVAPTFGLRRGLYEGCLMTFTMSLNEPSMKLAHDLCVKHLLNGLRNPKAVLRQQPAVPGGRDQEDFVRFGHYWLKRGPETILADQTYVITPSVQRKLSDLARIILTGKYPVLIQGPTSAGKTSAVEYLAKQTGHRFVRINNHEHTDIQEYLGTYASDPTTGKLAFREGLLVTAVRRGDWLVLDELNLAPTDVLEALNRLLDDNRELVIPETGEVVRPHPHFMLFATQNPPGLYAGRKVLSRAFRNRFLEVHFEDVPQEELQTILCQRCVIAPSYAQKIVQVFQELQHFRQAARMFESRDSYATLRDLFRWAGRDVMSYQQLAENGYILLAERARKDEDKVIVKQVLETTMKVKIDETSLYTISSDASSAFGRLGLPMPTTNNKRVVWTTAMQRLFTLVASAARYDEPILLIGETGAGKTSVCEVLAQVLKRELYSISCHQNMETADILGSQRPVRDRTGRLTTVIQKLQAFALEALGSEIAQPASPSSAWISETIERFERSVSDPLHVERLRVYKLEAAQCEALFEWHDGPLVHAMRQGGVLLLDELSLADDSVLERLNSVLEPSKTLVLAEKGGSDADVIRGSPGFQIVATMNPGGDFGKKELSPALRNRFTEIWVPAITDYDDLLQIMDQSWTAESLKQCSNMVISFFRWFNDNVLEHTQSGIGLRDLLVCSFKRSPLSLKLICVM
jgi:midasin